MCTKCGGFCYRTYAYGNFPLLPIVKCVNCSMQYEKNVVYQRVPNELERKAA